ncbi:MAG: hypothetical protein AAF696_07925 [Bacteroidota bacterium]
MKSKILFLLIGTCLFLTSLIAQPTPNIPKDYQLFMKAHANETFDQFFRIEYWTFWEEETAQKKTKLYVERGWLEEKDLAFAINAEGQILYYHPIHENLSHIYLVDEEVGPMFYTFSASAFDNFELTQTLKEEIETIGFEKQDLSPIADCPGSLFQYAFELKTSEYDDNFSEERNKKARELFVELAAKGHPEAANEMAYHYYFQDETEVEKVIEWREKAIALGHEESVYELADFLLDEKPDEIERVLSLLETLLSSREYHDKSALKLARLYMRGEYMSANYERGIELTKALAEKEHMNAMSDMAFYYYHAKGVEKDVKKALELLEKAETQYKERFGSGNWEPFIQKLKKELVEE